VRTLAAALPIVAVVVLTACSDGSGADAARAAASQAAEDRAAVEALASQAAADRAAAEERLAEARAAETKTAAPKPAPVPAPPAAEAPRRPVAVGRGQPSCDGPCAIDRRLTRSFLPQYSGEQTLLLASGPESDELGNKLHAFLVDAQGRVLWEEHGFGWEWFPVDERFGVRWDEAGHTFFRSYVADYTYLYVLDTNTGTPRLVGSPEGAATDGFQLGEIVERPGQAAFDVQETLVECPGGEDVIAEECPHRDVTYSWDGQGYR
jgi:hypothetical protein